MEKHTPGPWTVDIDKRGGDWRYLVRADEGRIQVAECNPYLDPSNGKGHPGDNVTLIAAAPDMLAALENILAASDANDGGWLIEAIASTRDLIAKARGQGPSGSTEPR